MSRRKLHWKRTIKKAGGDVNKVIPTGAKGTGMRWTKHEIPGRELPIPAPGATAGTTVTEPISQRKEALVRQWAK